MLSTFLKLISFYLGSRNVRLFHFCKDLHFWTCFPFISTCRSASSFLSLSFSWIFWQMQPKVPIESAFQVTEVKVLPNVLLLYDKDYQLPCWLPQPLSHCCTFWFWWHKHPTSGTNFFINEDRLHFDIVTNELWNTSGLTWRRLISCLNSSDTVTFHSSCPHAMAQQSSPLPSSGPPCQHAVSTVVMAGEKIMEGHASALQCCSSFET